MKKVKARNAHATIRHHAAIPYPTRWTRRECVASFEPSPQHNGTSAAISCTDRESLLSDDFDKRI
jgi:hypothetical protein